MKTLCQDGQWEEIEAWLLPCLLFQFQKYWSTQLCGWEKPSCTSSASVPFRRKIFDKYTNSLAGMIEKLCIKHFVPMSFDEQFFKHCILPYWAIDSLELRISELCFSLQRLYHFHFLILRFSSPCKRKEKEQNYHIAAKAFLSLI